MKSKDGLAEGWMMQEDEVLIRRSFREGEISIVRVGSEGTVITHKVLNREQNYD